MRVLKFPITLKLILKVSLLPPPAATTIRTTIPNNAAPFDCQNDDERKEKGS